MSKITFRQHAIAVMQQLMNTTILGSLDGRTLFYPCSGDDLAAPLGIFAPYCQDFWFVNTAYFRNRPPEQARPALAGRDL